MTLAFFPLRSWAQLLAGLGGLLSGCGIMGTASANELPISPLELSVRAYGATGDGATLDTAAINRAIDSAA